MTAFEDETRERGREGGKQGEKMGRRVGWRDEGAEREQDASARVCNFVPDRVGYASVDEKDRAVAQQRSERHEYRDVSLHVREAGRKEDSGAGGRQMCVRAERPACTPMPFDEGSVRARAHTHTCASVSNIRHPSPHP